jgi:hypothetical protein
MNLVILIDSAQMFFRNFGLRHVNAALGFAIGLAAPNAGQKMIARFARPVMVAIAAPPAGSRNVDRSHQFRAA